MKLSHSLGASLLAAVFTLGVAHAADAPAAAPATTPASSPVATVDAPAPAAAPAKPAAKARTGGKAPTTQPGATPGAASAAKQNEHIELDTTQITGNKELPKVMYVVPWKKADMGDFGGRPAKSLLDEVLAPVDRDVFKRQTRYYDALQPDAAAPASNGAAAGNEK